MEKINDKQTNDIAIRARDFSVFYNDFEAVKSINIDIPTGDVVAIIGPSGCGKSTFLRCINRINDLIDTCHTKGELFFNGQNIFDRSVNVNAVRTQIGMVFQKPNPFPKTIFDNIAYGPRLHGIKKRGDLEAIVERSLRKAALWDEVKDRLDKNALGLSGGQQQRLCIARNLAVEPKIVLMDEPTSALDPKATLKIEELVTELAKNYTIIIVTHNMQQAARISDKTAFFYEGELIEYGDTQKLFTKPEKKQTEDYLTGRFG